MRIKRVKIGIKSLKDALEDFARTAEMIEKGGKPKKSRGIYFENLNTFRRILTAKRLEMLHTIKKERPSSVYELARMLGRDMKNVTQDLEYLKEVGLVDVKRTGEKRERIIPEVNYDKIDLEIAI
jgi:predicted transcriptional regulator